MAAFPDVFLFLCPRFLSIMPLTQNNAKHIMKRAFALGGELYESFRKDQRFLREIHGFYRIGDRRIGFVCSEHLFMDTDGLGELSADDAIAILEVAEEELHKINSWLQVPLK